MMHKAWQLKDFKNIKKTTNKLLIILMQYNKVYLQLNLYKKYIQQLD